MSIERDPELRFHESAVLHLTGWIRHHEEGLAEWLKNVRLAYQSDRANVADLHRVAVFLFKDANGDSSARIGLLDVGGATLEDVSALDVWEDPNASSRGSTLSEEITQGNGGKAYMYRMFRGQTRLFGIKDCRRNCKGFEGDLNSSDRGRVGFIPSNAAGRDVPDCDWKHELRLALEPYNVRPDELPANVKQAIQQRQSLTLVEGVDPIDLHRGRIVAETLIERLLFHDQAVLAVQQIHVFAFHNGRIMRGGHRLELAPIRPYPGFETERVIPIPETLPNEDGQPLLTMRDGTMPGRLILRTSFQDMHRAYRTLTARWKISYRTDRQMIGSKSISELAPNCPGSYFVYGEVELAALSDYVALGRVRPESGPLVNALDRFIGEQIRELAREISDRRRQEQDQGQLDEVREENRILDQFKNRFLESAGLGGMGGEGTEGQGRPPRPPGPPPGYEFGDVPSSIDFQRPVELLRVARGVTLFPTALLEPRVKDDEDRTVRAGAIEWVSGDRHVVEIIGQEFTATGKGETEIWARLQGSELESRRIRVVVLNVDHVLLTPRNLEIPQGTRQQIQAEVTDDDGHRSTDVYLEWAHDSDDPLLVRISPKGSVFGNRVGTTSVRAGAGDPAGGVWARIPVDVKVVPNERPNTQGGGFPELRVTDRDLDPETGQRRESDPDRPSLFQDVIDYEYNIWWLNLAAPDAAFFFQQRTVNPINPILWRAFHAQKLVEMVGQVRMKEELTGDGREERPEVWARHKGMAEDFQVELMAQMWQLLQPYILTGQGLE